MLAASQKEDMETLNDNTNNIPIISHGCIKKLSNQTKKPIIVDIFDDSSYEKQLNIASLSPKITKNEAPSSRSNLKYPPLLLQYITPPHLPQQEKQAKSPPIPINSKGKENIEETDVIPLSFEESSNP